MLKEQQETEIRNYLLSKKLPIDILIEVQDHFISQIKNLEFDKNLQFPEAFKEVKENWRKDLQLSWAGGFDMNDSNDFMRKISKNILRVNLFSTLKFSFLGLFLALLGNLVLSDIAFKYFLAGLLSLTFSLPLINLIVNFKKFWFPRKYQNHILTLHQGYTFLILTFLVILMQYLQKTIDHPEYFQIFNYSPSNKIEFWRVILIYLGIFTLFSMAIFTFISQIKFLIQLKIVKPFLKYLKPD